MSRRPAFIASFALAACLLLPLAGCKQQAQPHMLAVPASALSRAAAADTTIRRIAVTHGFVVELPNSQVQARQQQNLAACVAPNCTVLDTRLDLTPNGAVTAAISVRVSPAHYQAFIDTAIAAPARLVSDTETAEDDTAPMLDIEKRLDAQIALRDRLRTLLGQPNIGVADLVAVEKQLAEVQGTIESETARQDYLRTMTETVRVDISYNGLIQQAGPLDLSPVRAALDGFVRDMIESLGMLITGLARVLPWLPVGLLGLWIISRLIRRVSR